MTDHPAARTGGAAIPFWRLSLAAMAGAAVALRWIEPTNTDMSWLITLSEKVLDGARPYRDFFEVNPPASIGLYLPGVALARWIGASPERVIDGLVWAGSAASLWLCAQVLAAARWVTRPALLVALAALVLLPANTFGEREHIVLIASLPMLACLVARLTGRSPPWSLAAVAGVAGGVAIAVKPMFALAFVGPLLLVWANGGFGAVLRSIEAWVAGLVAAAYGALVLLAFPDFIAHVLPIVVLAYVPIRLDLMGLLLSPGTLLWLVLVAALMALPRAARADRLTQVFGLASAGFWVAFLLQGKGWPYHAYPALALMMMAGAAGLAAAAAAGLRGRDLATPAGILALSAVTAFAWFDRHVDLGRSAPGLAEAIRQIAPHPRMMAVTVDIAVGHPLVRDLGGRWVGTFPSSWIHPAVEVLAPGASRATQAALHEADRLERATYAADIGREQPDVILVDGAEWRPWIDGDSALTAAFAAYRPAGTYGTITIWRRATP